MALALSAPGVRLLAAWSTPEDLAGDPLDDCSGESDHSEDWWPAFSLTRLGETVARRVLHLVPADYERKQTLVNAERFTTPELKEYESKILDAQEKMVEIERRIFSELRAAIGPDMPLPGILPEGRAAKPTARAVLAAFDGLCLTYTTSGIILDQLTQVQRTILALLNIPLPWPEKPEYTVKP